MIPVPLWTLLFVELSVGKRVLLLAERKGHSGRFGAGFCWSLVALFVVLPK